MYYKYTHFQSITPKKQLQKESKSEYCFLFYNKLFATNKRLHLEFNTAIGYMNPIFSIKEALHKIEHYCAYQERCHQEVIAKLRIMKLTSNEIDEIIVSLIENNYLNETRFACSFARGKHRIKFWGKIRIVNELKFRNISTYNINLGLKEISTDEYLTTFDTLSLKSWESIKETNSLKKRKKFCDYMLRKGFESNLVYEKMKEFEVL